MAQPATIFALSSGQGRAGIAVIRISGPRAELALKVMAGPRPKPRRAGGRRLRHPASGAVLDVALVLWFPGPNSVTGEDVAELHVHGGRAVVQAVLAALGELPGFRLAQPGEFTRRAFESGKIDLTQAEGLADLIDADTEAQRRLALWQMGGALTRLYESWRSELIEARGLVEAAIDFSDEADVHDRTMADAQASVAELQRAVMRHLADGNRGEIVRSGLQIVLAGPPNVGKSSVLNALARREAAIVSAEAGTTRDIVEVRLDLEGFVIVVRDTAGIREAQGVVEREGIRRTLAASRAADLVLWIMDATAPQPQLPPELSPHADQVLWVLNKVDLLPGPPPALLPDDMVAISATTGAGLDQLTVRLAAFAQEHARVGEEPVVAQVRHRRLLEQCAADLVEFLTGPPGQLELRAEDLRRAAEALGRITGRIDVEDVLDQVFARFCIGK